MFLKKVLNQPNLVGTVMITLMVCTGFVYTFASDGFNVETIPGAEVEAWLAAAGGGSSSGGPDPCDCMSLFIPNYDDCPTDLCESDDSDDHCGNDRAYCSENCAHRYKCKECVILGPDDYKCGNTGDLCGDTPQDCEPKPDDDDDDGFGGDAWKKDDF